MLKEKLPRWVSKALQNGAAFYTSNVSQTVPLPPTLLLADLNSPVTFKKKVIREFKKPLLYVNCNSVGSFS